MQDTGECVDPLKDVFELCDQEKTGFISIEHFKQLASDHFGTQSGLEELTGIIQHLDPDGKGQISYANFCEGVQHILHIKSSPRSSEPFTISFHGKRVSVTSCENEAVHDTSEHTYNEYDLSDTELATNGLNSVSDFICRTDVGNRPVSSEDDHDSAFSGPSNDDQRRDNEATDEDNFEDFGEADSGDDFSGSDSLTLPKRRHRYQNGSRSHSRDTRRSSAGHLSLGSASPSEIRRINRPSKKLTQNSRNTTNDEIFDDIDGNFVDLNDRVLNLQSQIGQLSDSQLENDDRHGRMREENTSLRERIHILEEQLRDAEFKNQDRLHEERRKHKDILARMERDKDIEKDNLSHQLQRLQREYEDLKTENPRLRAQIEKLKQENSRLEEKLSEGLETLSRVSLDFAHLQERHKQYDDEITRKQQHQKMVMEDMERELEELRDKEIKSKRRPSYGELPSRFAEIQSQVNLLKIENKKLEETNEDLNAQLFSRNVEVGRNLLRSRNSIGESLASEFEECSKDEIMEALREQQDDNAKLKEYIGGILAKIMEQHPALLEARSPSKT